MLVEKHCWWYMNEYLCLLVENISAMNVIKVLYVQLFVPLTVWYCCGWYLCWVLFWQGVLRFCLKFVWTCELSMTKRNFRMVEFMIISACTDLSMIDFFQWLAANWVYIEKMFWEIPCFIKDLGTWKSSSLMTKS